MVTHKPYALSETVREYILALRIHNRQKQQETASPEPDKDVVEFGVAKKTDFKKKRKKKKRKNVFGNDLLRNSIRSLGRHVSASELAIRKLDAGNAL